MCVLHMLGHMDVLEREPCYLSHYRCELYLEPSVVWCGFINLKPGSARAFILKKKKMLLSRHRFRQEGIAGREQMMNGENERLNVRVL
jgi:hypothetical protein